jgi:hypothetical protein
VHSTRNHSTSSLRCSRGANLTTTGASAGPTRHVWRASPAGGRRSRSTCTRGGQRGPELAGEVAPTGQAPTLGYSVSLRTAIKGLRIAAEPTDRAPRGAETPAGQPVAGIRARTS